MNRAQCPNCGDIIESKHTHDWVCCLCYYKSDAEQGIFICGNEHADDIGRLDDWDIEHSWDEGDEADYAYESWREDRDVNI